MTHRPILETATLHWPEEAACAQAAAALAAARPHDAVITLEGELGAGKTTFVRYLLRAMGVQGRIKSPTYAVIESYDLGHHTVSHFDFYRFRHPQEWEDAGFRDIFAQPGLKVCEWPQKAGGLMPRPDVSLQLQVHAQGDRQVVVQACSPEGLRLLGFLKPA